MTSMKMCVLTPVRRRTNSKFVTAVDSNQNLVRVFLSAGSEEAEQIPKLTLNSFVILKNFNMKKTESKTTVWLLENTMVSDD